MRISDWSSDVCSSDLLANGVIGTINAACEHIPLLLMSGRTPATEQGRFGARTVPIAWGQEMRDQAAMIRECRKWDYELRFPEQVAGLLDRAHAIASSTPKGPVYLALPRETLCEQIGRSEEHKSELPSLMRISYAVFRLKKNKLHTTLRNT